MDESIFLLRGGEGINKNGPLSDDNGGKALTQFHGHARAGNAHIFTRPEKIHAVTVTFILAANTVIIASNKFRGIQTMNPSWVPCRNSCSFFFFLTLVKYIFFNNFFFISNNKFNVLIIGNCYKNSLNPAS